MDARHGDDKSVSCDASRQCRGVTERLDKLNTFFEWIILKNTRFVHFKQIYPTYSNVREKFDKVYSCLKLLSIKLKF